MKNIFTVLLIAPFLLGGCSVAGVATGAGASVGVAASQEGGLSRAWSDAKIQAKINDLWFRYNVDVFRKLDLTVNQGRVLITGIVQSPEHRVEAVRLAWQPEGVKQVINEIRVADSEGIVGYARDTWISTRLRAAITFERYVSSINYNIDTVQGSVYLMGVAQNQAELNRVIEIARTIPDVKEVVSYVKLAGTPLPGSTPGQGYQAPAAPPANNADNVSNGGAYDPSYNPNPGGAPQPLTRQDGGGYYAPAPVQSEELR